MANNVIQHPTVVPVSAPPTKPLSKEEKQANYARLRERMKGSMLEIRSPESGRAYYWARKEDEHELARLDLLGFRITKSDPKTEKPIANGLRENGTYQLGDVILLDIDAETYEFLLDENRLKAEAFVPSAKEQFKADAAKAGIPTFEVTKPPKGV